jgi:hypothetical protein
MAHPPGRTRYWFCLCALVSSCSDRARAGEVPVESAPSKVQSLLEAGGVSLESYDPATGRSDLENFHASTLFELGFASPFRTKFRWTADGKWKRVTLRTVFEPASPILRHQIKVPHPEQGASFWDDPLVRHELDHVAIAADPRPMLIFERTLRSIRRVELKLSGRAEPKISGMVGRIEAQLRLRREAVFELVHHQNRKLDDHTRHGAVEVENRDLFFRELYELDSLDEAGFPFMAEILGLLREKSYCEAELLHLSRASDANLTSQMSDSRLAPRLKAGAKD